MKHMLIKDLIQVFVIDTFNPGIYTTTGPVNQDPNLNEDFFLIYHRIKLDLGYCAIHRRNLDNHFVVLF